MCVSFLHKTAWAQNRKPATTMGDPRESRPCSTQAEQTAVWPTQGDPGWARNTRPRVEGTLEVQVLEIKRKVVGSNRCYLIMIDHLRNSRRVPGQRLAYPTTDLRGRAFALSRQYALVFAFVFGRRRGRGQGGGAATATTAARGQFSYKPANQQASQPTRSCPVNKFRRAFHFCWCPVVHIFEFGHNSNIANFVRWAASRISCMGYINIFFY